MGPERGSQQSAIKESSSGDKCAVRQQRSELYKCTVRYRAALVFVAAAAAAAGVWWW